jgi:protein-disulfide isomerase
LNLSNNTIELSKVYDWDHVRGTSDARLTLIEYGDYECPDCGQVFRELKSVKQDLGADFRLVYRHYPYSGIHKHAQLAAEAAEAAASQDRFWEMHDILFENQPALQFKDLLKYASALDLDVHRFQKELKAHVYAETVRQNFIRGVHDGVSGTPGLFLNGVRYNGRFQDLDLKSLIEGL